MTDLDAKALELALLGACASSTNDCRCASAGELGAECRKDGLPITEAAIRAYLTAINYDAQRAVVEAAREWGSAVECAEDADNTALQDGSPTALSHADWAWTQANKARASLQAAVAALEGRTDV